MNLPAIDGLRAAPDGLWTALGRRLRAIGMTASAAVPFAKLAVFAPHPRRAAMAKWHLRRSDDPSAIAMRMLMFCDPVTPEEARRALGDEVSLDRLVETGLVICTEKGAVSAFEMQLLPDLYVLSDELRAGGDAAMGASPSTKSLAAVARPTSPVGRALDLGCGAGTLALAMAPRCERVVATDINERAVVMTRVNAALNALTNVECRQGDLFDPVRGETFDLIACQPPFVAGDGRANQATFLFGGVRGDELPVRVLRGLAPHLAPEGRAFVLAEWPVADGDPPLDARIVGAIASDEVSTLILQSPPGSIDDHCAQYAFVEHPVADDGYEDAAMRRRDQLERMRIHALQPAVIVTRRGTRETAWSSTVDMGPASISRSRVDAMIAGRDLLAAGRAWVLASKLRWPKRSGERTDEILTAVTSLDDVMSAIEHVASTRDVPPSDVEDAVLARVEEALLAGALDVVAP